MNYENLVLEKKDYVLLKRLMNLSLCENGKIERKAIKKLHEDLAKATIYSEEEMPQEAVRLNSTIAVASKSWEKTFQLVLPSQCNDELEKISIMSLMGMGVIGHCKGDRLKWESYKGLIELSILTVKQADFPTEISVIL